MSDRTYVSLTVFNIPAAEARAVLDVIEEYGLTDEGDLLAGDTLNLGGYAAGSEVSCGSAQEIADHLKKHAPSGTWKVHEDPAYQWLGDVFRYTPELRRWSASCDAEGRPVFTDTEILARMDDRAALERYLGVPWRNALDAARQEHKGQAVTALPVDEDDEDEGDD